jgi:hypothetical protein
MTWLAGIGFALLMVYEAWAAVTGKAPTYSQYVWRALGRYPQLGFLGGLGLGLLAGHLFL